jgi:hypothetical protein
MRFVLDGFRQDQGVRVFTFQGVDDQGRTSYTVRADLALSRTYGIRIQELPLLCRVLLEQRTPDEPRHLTFTEARMRQHAAVCAEARAAAARDKALPPRRPAGSNLGAGWRSPRF